MRSPSKSAARFVVATSILLAACARNGKETAQYETAPVSRGNLVQYATAAGSLGAVVSVDVGSQISGRIVALHVNYNATIKKGQLLAEIDPSSYEAAVRQTEADLKSAQATLELNRASEKRQRDLMGSRAISSADLDKAVADFHQAEANVALKQALLDRARADLGYCKIVAPLDGIVIARKVSVGQTLAAIMTTPVLFTVAEDLTKMQIEASVAEADIGQVGVGQTVNFTVDAYPDSVFQGQVAQVRKAPATTNNVVTYTTVIAVDNPEQKLFPGMTADVSILVAERKNALAIPNTALRFTPPEGTKFEVGAPRIIARSERVVYLPGTNGSTLKPVVVKPGISDGANTEILDGLKLNDRVVTTALNEKKSRGGFGGGGPPQS